MRHLLDMTFPKSAMIIALHRSQWGIAFSGAILALCGTLLAGGARAAERPIVFNRDVRPILSENCFACHGPDPGTRKAGLRLDTREGMFQPTPKRDAAVIPGKPEASSLWKRVITQDVDEVMPPPKSHKEIKPEQRAMLQRWIQEGAPWQPHWAFLKPERPAVPSAGAFQARVRNPIDAFVFSRLAQRGLSPAPEADRRTLARRLSLDLIGLPPKPEEVEAFVKDTSPDYYERYLDRLMSSAHWGEHRGRFWLDVARYADTHGLHFDNYREMWPYRDWVIQAFNRNLPFDQFTVEQLAGDLLPSPTTDQLIATGFQRCNPTTNEGGTIEDENLAGYARDRVETTSWAWLGLTANCAVCHDHKFDPITMKDFYSMSAFFRNTTQGGYDGNVKESSPSMLLITNPVAKARQAALPGELDTARKAVDQARKDAETDFESWVTTVRLDDLKARLLTNGLKARLPLDEGKSNQIAVAGTRGTPSVKPIGTLRVNAKGKTGPNVHFEKGATAEFRALGDVDRDDAFSIGGWVWVPDGFDGKAVIVSRRDTEKGLRGWDLLHEHGHYSLHLSHEWPENGIRLRTKNRVARKGGWQHVMLVHDGTGRPEGLRLFVDGRATEVETDRIRSLTGSIRTSAPLRLAPTVDGRHLDGLSVQDFRLYARALRPAEVRVLSEMDTLRDWLAKPVAERKPEPKQILKDYHFEVLRPQAREAIQRLASLDRESLGLRLNHPLTHVQKERTNAMGVAHVLMRGQYDKKKEQVSPAVFAALNPFPESAPRNRLGLAQWLTSPENPLMARVTVNRFWQEVFGVGLVKTAEEFGIMGETPVNQELLDWMAVEFREGGWDVKRLFRLILSSSAYRQSAETTAEKLEIDPANRLISRGPRFRMDAEMVRDYGLAASGLLRRTIGGVSVKPYQPDGVWEAVAMPESNTRYYHRDSGDSLYRRSLYTLWKRAAPPANMEIFNAPSRETSCLRRERTNTPLQALATLNDPQCVEAARYLAAEGLRRGRGNRDRGLDVIALKLLARPFTGEERTVVRRNLDQYLDFYRQHNDEALKLLGVGESEAPSVGSKSELAAWTLVANQLMNLDEVLNK